MKVPGLKHLPSLLSETSVRPQPQSCVRHLGLSNADELSRLVAAADFQNITVQRSAGTVEFPSVERFVSSYVAGSPLAGHVSQASNAACEHLAADTKMALEKYVNSRGLSFPITAHLLVATV